MTLKFRNNNACTFAEQEYDFLACYTTRITDIGTLFSSGHEANADEYHVT